MGKSTKPETEEQVEDAVVEEVAPEQEEGAAQPAEGLGIQDLVTAMQIIQVVGSRGAIRAEEMAVVGALYSKLQTFLKAAGALDEKPAETVGKQE